MISNDALLLWVEKEFVLIWQWFKWESGTGAVEELGWFLP